MGRIPPPLCILGLNVCNFICSLGCALTYITLSKDLWMVAATYGFVSAFGQNIALIPTLTTAMKWFPNRKGKFMESYGTIFKCSQFLTLICIFGPQPF